MCAQFELEKSLFLEKLEKSHLEFSTLDFKPRILPYTPSPVFLKKGDGKFTFQHMNFSLIPSWSKERKPKFATHNARLESITEKPTWKNLFGKKHCLVPMTCFIEPIYTGEYAGNMVKFNLNECVFVPGLFDTWHDKITGEIIESFAIVTGDPQPYVAEIGHDRSPIFLNQKEVFNWLETSKKDDQFFLNMLKHKNFPNFSIEIDRKLKKGWEKRI